MQHPHFLPRELERGRSIDDARFLLFPEDSRHSLDRGMQHDECIAVLTFQLQKK